MGCCLSAGNRRREAENRRSIDGEPPTSPRGILEVETVKEVLLETAVAPKAEEEKIKAMSPENQERKPPAPAIAGDRSAPGKEGGETASEVTEVSEVCSCGESLSAAAAETERSAGAGADDGVVDQPPPRKRRAPGGGRGRGRGRGERVAARRVAPPPPPPEKRVPTAAARNAAEDVRKKDAKEDPRARSRSPVGREEEVAAPPPPPPRKESDQKIPAGEAETLENPVVSLECFIFL